VGDVGGRGGLMWVVGCGVGGWLAVAAQWNRWFVEIISIT
jgi:hypothetical protein